MNYFLVDYENVKTHGLDGISKLNNHDTVCIFYSDNADSLTFGLHRRLNESKANILYQKVEVGSKNALDFQLASYLGYIIHEHSDNGYKYFIVSRDNGYSSLVNYWNKRKIDISIVMDVAGRNEKAEVIELKSQVEKVISEKELVETVVKIIRQYKTKQGIHTALSREFPSKDNKKSSEIYNSIKPILSDKKG